MRVIMSNIFIKLLYSLIPRAGALFTLALLLLFFSAGNNLRADPSHGIAMHGLPALSNTFRHLPYVDPDAPKGGSFTAPQIGSFDSTNPFIIKGVAAAGVRTHVFESLMSRNYSEPFSLYGLIAQKIETDKERHWVAFYLNKSAKFSDGKPVRVDDVIFSLHILRDKGRPNHQSYYKKVVRYERVEHGGLKGIKFHLKDDGDREMPLILGLMPILPEHVYGNGNFDKTTLDKPVGSGPYLVSSITPGKQIVYQRDKTYWGKDLPANRGKYNFDTVTFDYFRDKNTAFEAYKKGLLDYWVEEDPTKWATGYDFPAMSNGQVKKETFPTSLPSGMSALVFNTRKAKFSNIRIRQALLHIFDAEWINKQLFHNLYARTKSYYDRSALSSYGHVASDMPVSKNVIKPAAIH
jgi:peptide/nickel transport system substrate-binding protein